MKWWMKVAMGAVVPCVGVLGGADEVLERLRTGGKVVETEKESVREHDFLCGFAFLSYDFSLRGVDVLEEKPFAIRDFTYDTLAPDRFYFGASLLPWRSIPDLHIFLNNEEATSLDHCHEIYGMIQLRFGRTWNRGATYITPFVGLGNNILLPCRQEGLQMITARLSNWSFGVKTKDSLNSFIDMGVDVEIFNEYPTHTIYQYRDFELRPSYWAPGWGCQLGFPCKIYLSSSKTFNIHCNPFINMSLESLQFSSGLKVLLGGHF